MRKEVILLQGTGLSRSERAILGKRCYLNVELENKSGFSTQKRRRIYRAKMETPEGATEMAGRAGAPTKGLKTGAAGSGQSF